MVQVTTRGIVEARVGIEPTYKGFADLSLTTWVPRPDQAGGIRESRLYPTVIESLRTQAFTKIWSGRRDLNPRLRPWQGRTLPLSYSRSLIAFKYRSRDSARDFGSGLGRTLSASNPALCSDYKQAQTSTATRVIPSIGKIPNQKRYVSSR